MFKKLHHIWNYNNNLKYLMRGVLYSVPSLFMTGSIIQAFMLENGVSEKSVAFYVSVLQIVQVAVMLVASSFVDRLKNIIKIKGFIFLFQVSYAVLLAVISLVSGMSADYKYSLILIGGIIINLIQAINNIIAYKVPFQIMNINDYGHLNGKIGIVSGILGAAVSALLSYLTSHFNYNGVMFIMYIISAIFLVATGLVVLSYKPLSFVNEEAKKEEKKDINIFKYKPFYILFIPNLLRGFASGIFGTAMAVAYYVGIAEKSSGSTLALVLQIATLVSSYLFTVLSKKKLDDSMILYASLIMALSMGLMLVGGNLTVFYICYCAASFFINIINNAVPTAVMRIVDYDHIGQYTTWRMLCHTLGGAVASAVVIGMIDIFGGILTLVISALCQLISGVVYYIYIQILKKQNKYLM